jgi:hypothetical protein
MLIKMQIKFRYFISLSTGEKERDLNATKEEEFVVVSSSCSFASKSPDWSAMAFLTAAAFSLFPLSLSFIYIYIYFFFL